MSAFDTFVWKQWLCQDKGFFMCVGIAQSYIEAMVMRMVMKIPPSRVKFRCDYRPSIQISYEWVCKCGRFLPSSAGSSEDGHTDEGVERSQRHKGRNTNIGWLFNNTKT